MRISKQRVELAKAHRSFRLSRLTASSLYRHHLSGFMHRLASEKDN